MTTPPRSAARRVRSSAEAQATSDEYDRAQARLGITRPSNGTMSATDMLRGLVVSVSQMREEVGGKLDEALLRLDAVSSRLRTLENWTKIDAADVEALGDAQQQVQGIAAQMEDLESQMTQLQAEEPQQDGDASEPPSSSQR